MSSIGTGYDQSTTTFSPDGRVFQVEYAVKAVDNSSTAVGIRCKDGVVMAVEKPKLSKMIVEGSNRRILHVDKHSGICVSGMIADARQIVNHARYEAARYADFYGGSIPGHVLNERISGLIHMYTLHWCAAAASPKRARGARCAPHARHPHVGALQQLFILSPGVAPALYYAAPPPLDACRRAPA